MTELLNTQSIRNQIKNGFEPLDRMNINKARYHLINSSSGVKLTNGVVLGGVHLERFIDYSNKNPTMTEYIQSDDDGKFIRRLDIVDVRKLNDEIFATDWYILDEIDAKVLPTGSGRVEFIMCQILLSAALMAAQYDSNCSSEKIIESAADVSEIMFDDGDLSAWCDLADISFAGLEEVANKYWDMEGIIFLNKFFKFKLTAIVNENNEGNTAAELIEWLSH